MGDFILLDSPMIENAVKITANVKNAPRRFGRSSLKDTPVVSGGASDEYNGYFKVSISGDEVLIFDGSRPNSEYAGYTDLPGAQTVRRETLQFSMDSGDKTLYLLACHNKDNGYFIKFSFSERDDDCFYDTILARVSHNSGVTQIYKINDTIRFSKDFYL